MKLNISVSAAKPSVNKRAEIVALKVQIKAAEKLIKSATKERDRAQARLDKMTGLSAKSPIFVGANYYMSDTDGKLIQFTVLEIGQRIKLNRIKDGRAFAISMSPDKILSNLKDKSWSKSKPRQRTQR